MKIKLTKGMPLPAYAKPGDAAFDLRAAIEEPLTIEPQRSKMFGTGVAVQIPDGHFGMVVPRSSLGKRCLMIANTLGIIDSGYRGEIMVMLLNTGFEPQTVEPGERLLQMVIVPFVQVPLEQVDELDDSARGGGGIGSSGTH